MRKALVFLILLAMVFITACDNASGDVSIDASTNLSTSKDTNASMTSVDENTDSSQVSSDESSKDPYEGWTLVFGKIYIPNLPFSDWEGQNQDNINCYTIFINSRDSAAFHAYVKSLPDFGYTIEQLNSYEYKGTDPEDRKMHFTDPQNGWMQISIYY